MKKSFAIILFLMAVACTAYSQQTMNDTVQLNNGNLLIGRIIKYVPDEYLKIQTGDGVFFFTNNDMQNIRIHSVGNYQAGFDVSGQIVTIPASVQVLDISQAKVVVIKRSAYSRYNKRVDIPANMFLLEAGLDITGYSLQFIYNHKALTNPYVGIGYRYRSIYDTSYDNLIFELRNYEKTKSKNLNSFALDLGIGINQKWGLSCGPSFIINPSYLYAIKLDKNFYLTLGVDLNLQTNIYTYSGSGNSLTLGIKAGFLF